MQSIASGSIVRPNLSQKGLNTFWNRIRSLFLKILLFIVYNSFNEYVQKT